MPDVSVRLLIEAENRASAELARVNQDFARTGRAAETVTRSFNQTGRQVRILAGELSSELNPALGSIVTRATQAGGAVGGMGAGMAAATVAIVAGTAVLAAYIRNLHESAERQAALNLAVRSFDMGPIRAQLQSISLEMEKQGVMSGTYAGAIEKYVRRFTDALGFTTAEMKKLTEAQTAQANVLPIDRAQTFYEITVKQHEATRAVLAVEMQRAQGENNLEAVLRINNQILATIDRQVSAESNLFNIEQKRAQERAKAGNELPGEIERLGVRFTGLQVALGTRGLAEGEAQRLATEKAEREIRERLRPDPEQFELEGQGGSATEAQMEVGKARARAFAQERLQLEVDTAQILTQQVGLTKSQEAATALVVIEAERRLKFDQALKDSSKENLANLEAQVRTAAILQAELERTDADAGLAAGFRDVADTVEAQGQRMRDALVGSFQDINTAFGDIVVAGIFNQGAKLPDIGKRLAESLIRSMVDQFTTRATGSLFASLGGFFPGGARGVGGAAIGAGGGIAGALVAPSGVGAGTLIPAGAGFGRISATGAVQPVGSTAGSVAYGAGGDAAMAGGGGGGLGGLPVTSLVPNGPGGGGFFSGFFGPSVGLYDAAIAYQAAGLQGVAALQSGQAVISGGQFIATTELAAFGGYEAAGAGASLGTGGAASSAAGAGATLAASATVILGVAALAYGTYSAFQNSRTTTDVAINALSGAVTGAVVGSVFGPVGTVVGAIAGAAIQGGAAYAGKMENEGGTKIRASQRSRTEGDRGAQALQTAIQSAQSLADIAAIFNKRWSAFGEVAVYVRPAPGGGIWWAGDYDDPGTHIFTEEDFTDPLVVDNVHVAHGETGVLTESVDLTAMLKQRILDVVAQEARAMFAYEERFDAPGMSGTAVTRLTVLPSTRIREAEGQQILFSRDQFLFAQFDDDQIEQLIRKMAKVDRDRQLGALDAEHLIF